MGQEFNVFRCLNAIYELIDISLNRCNTCKQSSSKVVQSGEKSFLHVEIVYYEL